MYDLIEDILSAGKRAVVLVPEQYTLEAEKNALHYLKKNALIHVEILGMNRFMHRILNEVGGSGKLYVDARGKNMLIAAILAKKKTELNTYGKYANVSSFVDALSDNITRMQLMQTKPEQLLAASKKFEDEGRYIPAGKLGDIYAVYSEYRKRLSGGLEDLFDENDYFISQIHRSEFVKNTHFFLADFDMLMPRELNMLGELMIHAAGLNLYFNYEKSCKFGYIFDIVRSSMEDVKALARDKCIECEEISISASADESGYLRKLSSGIAHLERELFALPFEGANLSNSNGITLIQAANIHSELETAVAYINHLVMDKGLRYRDIAVMASDLQTRGVILKSILAENEIPAFIDQTAYVRNNPALLFIKTLLDLSFKGKSPELMLRLAKTGFTPISAANAELLEEYCEKYAINGARFAKPFENGSAEYGRLIEKIERIRISLIAYVDEFFENFKASRRVNDRLKALYEFLEGKAEMQLRLAKTVEAEHRKGNHEKAIEITQIWEGVVAVFDQMSELSGDESLGMETFANIFASGLDSIGIGLIPPTADCVLIGDVQRTHFGKIKALLVLGMNEGLFPPDVEKNRLLSDEELSVLREQGIKVGIPHDRQRDKYLLNIYRMLTAPNEYLYMSCAVSDLSGNGISSSRIFNAVCEIFGELTVQKDIFTVGNANNLIQRPAGSLKHLIGALRTGMDKGEVSDPWLGVASWYKENRHDDYLLLQNIMEVKSTRNMRIPEDLAHQLYSRGELVLSPSRLEDFGRCPFKFFVDFGLRPDKWEIYGFGGRELGDIFHDLLRYVAEHLNTGSSSVDSCDSLWNTATDEMLRDILNEYFDEIYLKYKEGILAYGDDGEFRKERLKRGAFDIVKAMVILVRGVGIERIVCEEKFGRGGKFEALTIESDLQGAATQVISLEGKIDRVDYYKDGSYGIVDYKTGSPPFSITEILGGRQLQLMIYSKAVERYAGGDAVNLNYILVDEVSNSEIDWKSISDEELADIHERQISRAFQLRGIRVNTDDETCEAAGSAGKEAEVLGELLDSEDPHSTSRNSIEMTREQFDALNSAMNVIIKKMCVDVLSGDIGIRPNEYKGRSSCQYCEFRAICMFDEGLAGCKVEDLYENVKEKLKNEKEFCKGDK